MLDKTEMSLDDIIKQTNVRKKQGGGAGGKRPIQTRGGALRFNRSRQIGGGRIQKRGIRPQVGGGGGPRFPRGNVNSTWKHDMFDGVRKNRNGQQGATKLLISNLDFGVSESDIKELFSEFSTTGPLKGHSVHYDRSGRSLGTADIVFERRTDALKAMKTYSGVPLDGRPMSIQLATSDLPSPRAPPMMQQQQQQQQNRRRNTDGPNRNNWKQDGPRNNWNGRRQAPNKDTKKQKPTLAELDAELDAYTHIIKI